MDASETLVKERFDAAVGGLSPDVTSLVGGGVSAGRGIRRRRRLMGAGAAAVTAALVGTVALTGGLGGVLGSLGPEPAGPPSKMEHATARGLAAAVMTHTEGLGTVVGVGGKLVAHGNASSPGESLAASIAYRTPSGTKLELDMYALSPPTRAQLKACHHPLPSDQSCTRDVRPDGTTFFVFRFADVFEGKGVQGHSKAHALSVLMLRAHQLVVVNETVVNSARPPLSVADLEGIAGDPNVGVWTTAGLNDAGLDIADFKNSIGLTTWTSSISSGGGTSTRTTVSPPHRAPGSGSGPR